jgi:hypothetical protein
MASGQYVLAFEKAFNHTRYGASSIEIIFQNINNSIASAPLLGR